MFYHSVTNVRTVVRSLLFTFRVTLVTAQCKTYYRFCFSDLATAQAFIEQFGGTVYIADAR